VTGEHEGSLAHVHEANDLSGLSILWAGGEPELIAVDPDRPVVNIGAEATRQRIARPSRGGGSQWAHSGLQPVSVAAQGVRGQHDVLGCREPQFHRIRTHVEKRPRTGGGCTYDCVAGYDEAFHRASDTEDSPLLLRTRLDVIAYDRRVMGVMQTN
jgi:hypothetical protein